MQSLDWTEVARSARSEKIVEAQGEVEEAVQGESDANVDDD